MEGKGRGQGKEWNSAAGFILLRELLYWYGLLPRCHIAIAAVVVDSRHYLFRGRLGQVVSIVSHGDVVLGWGGSLLDGECGRGGSLWW